MKNSYTPISCSFYDELEAFSTLRENCTIHFMDANGKEAIVESKILDLYTKDKIEYIKLEKNLTLRLDQLISVNGKVLKDYC